MMVKGKALLAGDMQTFQSSLGKSNEIGRGSRTFPESMEFWARRFKWRAGSYMAQLPLAGLIGGGGGVLMDQWALSHVAKWQSPLHQVGSSWHG